MSGRGVPPYSAPSGLITRGRRVLVQGLHPWLAHPAPSGLNPDSWLLRSCPTVADDVILPVQAGRDFLLLVEVQVIALEALGPVGVELDLAVQEQHVLPLAAVVGAVTAEGVVRRAVG